MKFYILCAVLISCKSCICSYIYNAIPRNADVFSPCENQPKNVLDINGAADLSKTHFGYTENGEITCSGNATTIWDIQPNDRISFAVNVMRFDRGSWVPTQYSLKVPNFCRFLFVKNDFWYDCWIKHVINAEQIKDKCLQPGVVFMHEAFSARIRPRLEDPDMEGLFKTQIKLNAFSMSGKERPTSICFEIEADMERE